MTAKTRTTTATKPTKKQAPKAAPAKAAPAKAAKPKAAAAEPKAAKPPKAPEANITHEMIAARAHQLWVAAGCPDGQDAVIWLRAEAELRAENARP